MTTKKVICWDVDGTLANITHRRQFVASHPKNWPAFNRAMVKDTPYEDMVWLFKVLAAQPDTVMLVVSGRGSENRTVTEQWLHDAGIEYTCLLMRPVKDHRQDYIIKSELLEQIRNEYGEPFMVFDDRDQVVDKAWRANGVRCLQVCEGDF